MARVPRGTTLVRMLTLEYANCLSERIGEHGLNPASLTPGAEADSRAADLTSRLESMRADGSLRWRDLPFDPMRREHADAVKRLAEERRGRFDNLVVLGIGGSALGTIALHAALNPPTHNLLPAEQRPGPRLFVLDNVDPQHVGATLDYVRSVGGGLERTLFVVVSKSGETAETAAQFLAVRDLLIGALGREQHAEHIIAITDPNKGTLRRLCDDEGYAALPVPDGVGGRFSVLSPVGLFPAAMCGIDIESLLSGAEAMDRRCTAMSLRENPAATLATLLVRLGQDKGKTNHVLMPYSNALYSLADWFRQLWAESLGKRYDADGREVFAGFTPIKALGATDQHSQIQLYREGPNDKVIGLVEVEQLDDADVPIPAGLNVEPLKYLQGASLGRLLSAEKRATEYALVESQRPNFTIRTPRIDARHVGEFLQLWMVATAYAGLMLNIDAYDQPAVETGKKATFGLMGREGYTEVRDRVDQTLRESEWIV